MKKKIAIILIILFIIILFITPEILKKLAVDNSIPVLGRKIFIDDIDINFFSGNTDISGFVIYESDNSDTFISFKNLNVNISMLRLFIGKIYIEQIRLDDPNIKIIYNKDGSFNFSDIIIKFSEKEDETDSSENKNFSLKNLIINNGLITFSDKTRDSSFDFSGMNFHLPFFAGIKTPFEMNLKTIINNSARFSASLSLNIDSGDYKGSINLSEYNITLLKPYLKEFCNFSDIAGGVGADLNVGGNYKSGNLILKADNIIKDFYFTSESETKPIVSFSELKISLNEFDFINKKIDLKSISLKRPSVYFSVSKSGTSFSNILRPLNSSNQNAGMDTTGSINNSIPENPSEFANTDSGSFVQDKNETGSANFKFSISEFIIDDGSFVFKNRILKNRQEHTFGNIGFKASNINNVNDFKGAIDNQNDNINFNSKFSVNNIGNIILNLTYNPANDDYAGSAQIDNLLLNVFQSYIAEFANISLNDGILNLKAELSGNLKNNISKLTLKQNIKNLNLSETINRREIFSVKDISLDMPEFDLIKKRIVIEKIKFDSPKLNFENYDKNNNFSFLIKSEFMSNTEPAKTGKAKKEEIPLNLVLKKFEISNGSAIIKDLNIPQPFTHRIEKISFSAKNILYPAGPAFSDLKLSSIINRTGKLAFDSNFKIDLSKLTANISFDEFSLPELSPYSLKAMAYPILSGKFIFNSKIDIVNRKLKSENIIDFNNFDLGEKNPDFEGSGMPVKLALAVLRDKNKNIRLDIPIEGNVDDPEFKLNRVIWYAIKNVLIKAATSPFGLLAKLAGGSEEELKEIRFDFLQIKPGSEQNNQFGKLKKILDERTGLKIEFVHFTDFDEEKKMFAANFCKESYFRALRNYPDSKPLSAQDMTETKKISESDSNFLQFLTVGSKSKLKHDKSLNSQIQKTFENLCSDYIGIEKLDKLFGGLIETRILSFREYFLTQNLGSRIIFESPDSGKIDIENKRPHFKIQIKTE
ncbi:MAG TPA: DUF748 domain-containing protein [bacterium]|nr:DUF748 domain-containing protein [bacterium]